MKCIFAGKPTPTVRWWRSDHLVDSIDVQITFPNVKQNQLYVRRLERADLHATYTCQASNNNISQPVFAKVSLDMHCEYKIYPLSRPPWALAGGRRVRPSVRRLRPDAKWFLASSPLPSPPHCPLKNRLCEMHARLCSLLLLFPPPSVKAGTLARYWNSSAHTQAKQCAFLAEIDYCAAEAGEPANDSASQRASERERESERARALHKQIFHFLQCFVSSFLHSGPRLLYRPTPSRPPTPSPMYIHSCAAQKQYWNFLFVDCLNIDGLEILDRFYAPSGFWVSFLLLFSILMCFLLRDTG